MSETDTSSPIYYLEKANELWSKGETQQALALYEKAVAALPEDASPELIVNVKRPYALCLSYRGDVATALEIYPELEGLCVKGELNPTLVLRQWAMALEVSGQFRQARKTYDKIRPEPDASSDERLKWEHAVGLLNWREGRLTEAAENLAAASAQIPADPEDASQVLAVLGNDALLSLDLGNDPRALKLVDRMLDVRAAVAAIPLPSEVNLIRVRAALARRRKDFSQEVQIWKDGEALIKKRDAKNWLVRLDLAGEYVAATQRAGESEAALPYLKSLCAAAPFSLAWIGALLLAQVQLETKDYLGAKESTETVLGSFVGGGPEESEAEVISILAGLADLGGTRDATIFLGKLALKYLTDMARNFDSSLLRQIIDAGSKMVKQTAQRLREAARFEEALAIEDLFERVSRYALVLRRPTTEALSFQPIPFDQAEVQAHADWLEGRRSLVAHREEGEQDKTLQTARALVESLMQFKTSSGLGQHVPRLGPPKGNSVRLSLVPLSDSCQLQYQWSDRTQIAPLEMPPSAFNNLVGALRKAVSDNHAWCDPAEVLYRLLIGPIKAELDQVSCLEVDATGILGRIPMGLLSDGECCLLQCVPVKYVLNLDPSQHGQDSRQGLAHFAAFSSGALSTTPEISGLNPSTFVLGSSFTREALLEQLAARPAYVSVATHLETEPTRPDLSALLLGTDVPLYLADFADDQFDLNGVQVVLFAACSSGLGDATDVKNSSVAALVLEKGACCFVGTLWDISESAAAEFTQLFWQALSNNRGVEPAKVLAMLQSDKAATAQQTRLAPVTTGGIGSPSQIMTPEDWAGFAIFENCNVAQPKV